MRKEKDSSSKSKKSTNRRKKQKKPVIDYDEVGRFKYAGKLEDTLVTSLDISHEVTRIVQDAKAKHPEILYLRIMQGDKLTSGIISVSLIITNEKTQKSKKLIIVIDQDFRSKILHVVVINGDIVAPRVVFVTSGYDEVKDRVRTYLPTIIESATKSIKPKNGK